MKRRESKYISIAIVTLLTVFITSCESEFNTIGVDVVDDNLTNIAEMHFDVVATNKKLNKVRTDGLSAYQLANFQHPVYGNIQSSFVTQLSLQDANPTFGKLTPEDEINKSENEKVTKVTLYIPFFSTNETAEETSDENTVQTYKVDSIYGEKTASFSLKIQEYTKFLRNLDPDSNFEETQAYYSNEDPFSFATTVLYENDIVINTAETINKRAPGIEIELNTLSFFQEKIIDNEGKSALISQNNFNDFLRGLFISIDGTSSNNIAILLNLTEAFIDIAYEYDTEDSDGNPKKETDTFKLNIGGQKVNYINQETYPSEITNAFSETNASRLYVHGGVGSYVEIDIIGDDNNNVVQMAKENSWLINEANLVFHVDTEIPIDKDSLTLPPRLYLYDFDNKQVLQDYVEDISLFAGGDLANANESTFVYYDGRLTEEDGNRFYKFRITEHIANLVNNDTANVKLGLSVSSNIANTLNVSAFNDDNNEEITIPQAAIPSYYGTILYGNNISEENKKLQLEIYYTEPK